MNGTQLKGKIGHVNMRLTKKVGENYCSQSGDFYDLYNKLGKLEDLEEKLCCPLEAVIKAIIQNCFYDGSDYKETNIGLIDQEGDLGIVISVEEWEYGNTMYLKDYKKTWWLKEDKSE